MAYAVAEQPSQTVSPAAPLVGGPLADFVFLGEHGERLVEVKESRRRSPLGLCSELMARDETPSFLVAWSVRFPSWADRDPIVPVIDEALAEAAGTPPMTVVFRSTNLINLHLSNVVRALEGKLEPTRLLREVWLGASSTSEPVSVSRDFRRFTELRHWLGLSSDEAADLLGIGRTTPNAWERDGRRPRARTARKLAQIHSLLASLVHSIGEDETTAWMNTGDPSPLQRIAAGDVQGVARLVEARAIRSPRRAGLAPGGLVIGEGEPRRVDVPTTVRRRRRRAS
jgi:DNA-binding XRE family transcriptional regulator